MSTLEFNMARLPSWMQLGNIPFKLFTQRGISYIASAVGTPLYMDHFNANQQRLAYAKVCVEVGSYEGNTSEYRGGIKEWELCFSDSGYTMNAFKMLKL